VTGTRRCYDFHFSARWWPYRHNPRAFDSLLKSLDMNCWLVFLHRVWTSTMFTGNVPVPTMKVQKGSKDTFTHKHPHYAGVVSFTSRPIYPRRKKPCLTTEYEAERVSKPVWTIWGKEKSVTPKGQRNPDSPARNIVTIPTTDNSQTRLKRHRFMGHLVYSVRCWGINYFLTIQLHSLLITTSVYDTQYPVTFKTL
jgi:hypothetical protein